MKANSPWVFLPLAGFVLLAVVLASGLGRDPQALPSALVGKPVPGFTLPSLLTEETFTEQPLTGRWQLLNVWAPGARLIEHPYLLTLAAQGMPIAGLNYKDDCLRHRITWPIWATRSPM